MSDDLIARAMDLLDKLSPVINATPQQRVLAHQTIEESFAATLAAERTARAQAEQHEQKMDQLRAALEDAVLVARNYYALWHDETWKERLTKWGAALSPQDTQPSEPSHE
jgi:hypothetical protein